MKLKISYLLLLTIVILFSCKTGKEKEDDKLSDLKSRKWWKEAVIYQLYPRSFQDSDGRWNR